MILWLYLCSKGCLHGGEKEGKEQMLTQTLNSKLIQAYINKSMKTSYEVGQAFLKVSEKSKVLSSEIKNFGDILNTENRRDKEMSIFSEIKGQEEIIENFGDKLVREYYRLFKAVPPDGELVKFCDNLHEVLIKAMRDTVENIEKGME